MLHFMFSLLLIPLSLAATTWPPSDELSDDTACVAASFSDTTLSDYRYNLKLPNSYNNSYNGTIFHPLFASASLHDDGSTADESLTRAAIFMHGLGGDANVYFCDAFDAAPDNVIVIAPWFGDAQVSGDEWEEGYSSWTSTYWTSSSWVKGGDSSPSPSRYTTSFDVLDSIVEKLSSLKNSGKFPNLERVTINGFSAGAQLASRWSIFSPYANGDVDGLDLVVRTVVADGSSYVYLDDTRPENACTSLEDTGMDHTCDNFEVPDSASTCTSYDSWKYGLDFTNLTANVYLEPFAASSELLSSQIETFLANTEIRFLFGDEDVCNCNTEGYDNPSSYCYPSGTSCSPNDFGGKMDGVECCDTYPDTGSSNALAVGCEEMLQGSNRLQRGINYMLHLESLGANVTFGFFDGGHSNEAFYDSDLFK
eukprot:CAMPEP_0118634538 /NCGR_PEP_ID=MMETSP0785-20121206/1601_1 /TAXON_ID=91992 /ORGANISM="Bolidomonas pacifica, Strain CCMP 1866" /LENGTH=422 /DNA_ID=CAMNT_0006525521 /DNA_START=78 /DNA_END=1343 /DNA_ORIENTATION=+